MVPVRLGSRYGSSQTWARLKTKNRISSGGDEPVCFGSSRRRRAAASDSCDLKVTSSGVANPKGDRADKSPSKDGDANKV
jgi:hypothetical protein